LLRESELAAQANGSLVAGKNVNNDKRGAQAGVGLIPGVGTTSGSGGGQANGGFW